MSAVTVLLLLGAHVFGALVGYAWGRAMRLVDQHELATYRLMRHELSDRLYTAVTEQHIDSKASS